MRKNSRCYYESLSMAEYALEGHTQLETAEEFGVSATTVRNRINGLASIKPKLYHQVVEKWHKNSKSFESKII